MKKLALLSIVLFLIIGCESVITPDNTSTNNPPTPTGTNPSTNTPPSGTNTGNTGNTGTSGGTTTGTGNNSGTNGGSGTSGTSSGCPTTANCGCSNKKKAECNSSCCKWIVGTGCKCR